MRKTLTAIALGIALSTTHAELETVTTNSENRVSSIVQDDRAIKSDSSGKIPVSKELCQDFITEVPLLGKLAYLFNFSPYVYEANGLGETTFHTKDTTSTIKYMRDTFAKDFITKEIEMEGTRPYISDFKAYMRLDCKTKGQEIEYNSVMYIVIKNGLRRFAVNGLRFLPYTGDKIEEFFKSEQDSVGKMMGNLAKKMCTNPNEFYETAISKTNNVPLSQEEKIKLEEIMKEHRFLR